MKRNLYRIVLLGVLIAIGCNFELLTLDTASSGFMLGLVSMYIPGKEGASAIGKDGLMLGPCNLYFGKFDLPNAEGGIHTGGILSKTIIGDGTYINDLLRVGQSIEIKQGAVRYLRQIRKITSNTSFELDQAVNIAAATIADFAPVSCINLGGCDKATLKFAVKKAGMKEAQQGDVDADKAVVGAECSVELGMTRPTLTRLQATLQGFKTVRSETDGSLIGAAFTLPIGETDSEIAKELRLVRLAGGVESSFWYDVIQVVKCAPEVNSESSFDNAQRIMKTMFVGYPNYDELCGGAPVIFKMGDLNGIVSNVLADYQAAA